MSKAQEPLAYLVTGGRMYLDRAFTSKTHAETSVSERKDGATIVPLYAASASSEQQAAQQDAELSPAAVESALSAWFDYDGFSFDDRMRKAYAAARASNGGKA